MSESTSAHNRNRRLRWLLQSVGGLLLTGAGMSMVIDAGFQKFQGNSWVLYGTAALIVFQSGLCLVADSVRFRN